MRRSDTITPILIGLILVFATILMLLTLLVGKIDFSSLRTIISTRTPSQTEKHLQYASMLRDAVDAFESSRNDASNQIAMVADQISEVTENINGAGLNDNREEAARGNATEVSSSNAISEDKENKLTIEFEELAIMWETEWVEVHSKFDSLSKRFVAIGAAADDYFKQLNSITESIVDSEIKFLEQEKNRQLYDEWNAAYKQAAADLEALEILIDRGDDFEKILQLAALRVTISEDIVQVQEISVEAQSLLAQLGQLTVEGHKLIRGQSDM